MKIHKPLNVKLSALAVVGIALVFNSVAEADSLYHGSSDFTLTLTSFSNPSPSAALGVNLFVSSAGTTDYNNQLGSGVYTLASTPLTDGPVGDWAVGDGFHQYTGTGGTAGDLVGTVNSDLATTGTITFQSATDATTTFNFDWSLNMDSHVGQSGFTPLEDYAEALAEFSLTTSTGFNCTTLFPLTSISTNTVTGVPGGNVISGSFSCDLLAGRTDTISIFEHASGQATALYNVSTVPLPAALWMMLPGLGMFGFFSRRRLR